MTLKEFVYQHVLRTNVDVQALVFVYHTLSQSQINGVRWRLDDIYVSL